MRLVIGSVARDERYVDHALVEVSVEAIASLNFGLTRMLEQGRKLPAQPNVTSQTSITT
jgi:hypothetical protein